MRARPRREARIRAARRFSREVNSRWPNPHETRENYLDLAWAMDDAFDELGRCYRRHDGGYGRPGDGQVPSQVCSE